MEEEISIEIPGPMYIGICFQGEIENEFWRIKCPCGVEVKYPVNGLPGIDTLHPCGNKDHWSVMYIK